MGLPCSLPTASLLLAKHQKLGSGGVFAESGSYCFSTYSYKIDSTKKLQSVLFSAAEFLRWPKGAAKHSAFKSNNSHVNLTYWERSVNILYERFVIGLEKLE